MNCEEMNAKLEAIANSPETKEALANAESREAIQKIFAENGLEFSLEDIDELIAKTNIGPDGELDEAALDEVAGGWANLVYNACVGCINYGIMIGNAIFKNNAKYIKTR